MHFFAYCMIGFLMSGCFTLAVWAYGISQRSRRLEQKVALLGDMIENMQESVGALDTDLLRACKELSGFAAAANMRMDYIEAHTGTAEVPHGRQEGVGERDAASVHADWEEHCFPSEGPEAVASRADTRDTEA